MRSDPWSEASHDECRPMETSRSLMVSTSAMRGTFPSRYSPSASSVAAISLSTEFLAPPIRTEPSKGGPGRTTSCCTGDQYAGLRCTVPGMREHVDETAVVELTQALVRIDTRNPPGNEQAAASAA